MADESSMPIVGLIFLNGIRLKRNTQLPADGWESLHGTAYRVHRPNLGVYTLFYCDLASRLVRWGSLGICFGSSQSGWLRSPLKA